MDQEIAYLNSPGVDIAVTTSSTATALPMTSSWLIIKNVGTAEAFVTGGAANVTATASAATSMSIPPGAIESYRVYKQTGGNAFTYLAAIGTAATTLRVYCAEGI